MEIVAISRSVRISPRKVRLVAGSVRSHSALQALTALSLVRQRAAIALWKTIKSAMSNATNNAKLKEDGLYIKAIEVSEGQALKRFHPSTRGRIHPYKKKSSHIKVVLSTTREQTQNA